MKKEIGVEKASRLSALYNKAITLEECIRSLQQLRMSTIEKLYDNCSMLDVPVDNLKVSIVEGTVEWPDPKEEKKEK